MNTGEEKFAQTQPLGETNDADKLNREAGLEMNDVDKLGEQTGLENERSRRIRFKK